jgi:hypothetical protein
MVVQTVARPRIAEESTMPVNVAAFGDPRYARRRRGDACFTYRRPAERVEGDRVVDLAAERQPSVIAASSFERRAAVGGAKRPLHVASRHSR